MADIDLKYPAKLERFRQKSCMTMYYSEPICSGVFNQVILNDEIGDLKHQTVQVTCTEFDGWLRVGSIFSCGFFAGEVVAIEYPTMQVSVNKESWVTATEQTAWFTKHNGTHYNFELLRDYNGTDVKNAILFDVGIMSKTRTNKDKTYSPWGFDYSKDYSYQIKTKRIPLTDQTQIDDIIRANSVVIKSNDDSVIKEAAVLDDLPDVIGNTIAQPYFGGTQNNEWYRATIVDKDFTWTNNKIRVILTLEINS